MSRQRGSSGILFLLIGALLLAAVGYLLLQDPTPGPAPTPDRPGPEAQEDPELPAPAEAHRLEVRPGDRETLPTPSRTEIKDSDAASGGTIFGLVMDQANLPVPGARVFLRQRLNPTEHFLAADKPGGLLRFSKTTNKDGRYWFDDLPLGSDFDMWVSHPDYAGKDGVPVTVLSEDQTVPPVVLSLGYQVLGSVVDSGGNPLAATLVLQRRQNRPVRPKDYPRELRAGRRIEIQANADGSFVFEKLAGGIWSLTAQHEGYADYIEQAVVLSNDQQQIDKKITLGSEFQIAGTVRDGSGQPVPGAVIYVARSRPRPLYSSNTEGDDGGYFSLRGLPEGVYTVTAEASGYSRASVPRVEAGREDLEIVLHERGSVSGRVTSPEGKPVTRFSLELFQVNRSTSNFHKLGDKREFKSPTGDYRFEDIEPGTYKLLASGPGFSPTYSPGFTVEREEVQGVDVQLSLGARLTGLVLDPEGNPIPGAEIKLHGRDWTEENSYSLFGGRSPDPNNVPEQLVLTDGAGAFDLHNAYTGTVKVGFSHGSFLSEYLTIDLTEGGVQDIGTVKLRRGGVISGVGSRADGSPLAGGSAYLTLKDQNGYGYFSRTGRLDSQGRFRFAGLRTGTYQVTVAPADGGTMTLFPSDEMNSSVTYVAEGQEVELRLTAQ